MDKELVDVLKEFTGKGKYGMWTEVMIIGHMISRVMSE